MKTPKFSIIIASYNGEQYLNDCLSAVSKTDYPNFEVLFVDDASTDNSLEIVKKFQKKFKFRFIQNKINLGLVANRNRAITLSKGDILVFLDNDTAVDKNWLKSLAQTFSSDNTIGAAQCKMFDFGNRDRIQQAGMKLIPFTGFGSTIGRGEKDNGQFDHPTEIISLGAALAVRKDVVKKIKGFDNKLFHYTDDLDFSWRVWIAGFRIVLSPDAKVYHHLKIHNPSSRLYYHLSKNSLRMVMKNYEFKNVLIYLPCSLVFNLLGGVYVLITRRNLAGIKGVFMGIFWTIENLSDNLKTRAQIQKVRKVSDDYLFEKIMVSKNIISIYRKYLINSKITVSLMKDSL